MGVPKVKSAFDCSVTMPDAKIKKIEIVFSILRLFQRLLSFSGRTLCTVLFTAIPWLALLLKTGNRRDPADLLAGFLKIAKIHIRFVDYGG